MSLLAMPTFSSDGIEFFYRETGEGRPFLFQHGLGADSSQPFFYFTPPPGIRLIALDCRAHGQTRPVGDPEKISIPQFADDARALLRHLKISKAIVGGISMGAALALHLALENPQIVAGLVLCRPAWVDERRQDELNVYALVVEYLREYGPVEGAARFQQTAAFQSILSRSPDNAQSLVRQFLQPGALETSVRLEKIPRFQPMHSRADWGRISVPVLVLANRDDPIHPLEYGTQLAERIPGAQFQELPSKSLSPEGHAAQLQQALERFLQRIRPANA